MTARDEIELALAKHCRRDPEGSAARLLAQYDAELSSAEAYPGELVMLRGLVATLRAVAEHGDLSDVRQLLAEHQRDEQDAYDEAGEKSSPAGADATPGPTGRVGQLLDAIRTARGRWTTVTAFRFYRECVRSTDGIPNTQLRAVARGDLRDLAAWGHLLRHEEPGRQYYTLKTRNGGA